MTVKAISSLKKHLQKGTVGVIFPPNEGKNIQESKEAVEQSLQRIDPNLSLANIVYKEGSNHFENWNGTQYKLDIQSFANEYDPIVLLDSDTIAMKDLIPYIQSFIESGKKFAFLKDHVTGDSRLQDRWEGTNIFIPQTSFMIFRSEIIEEFFKLWEDTWREWITPSPFANHADPAPYVKESLLWIDQYALAQAIFKFIQPRFFDGFVSVIERKAVYIARNLSLRNQRAVREFLVRTINGGKLNVEERTLVGTGGEKAEETEKTKPDGENV